MRGVAQGTTINTTRMGKRFDWLLLAGLVGFTMLCQFVLLVPHPRTNYSGEVK